MLMCPTGVLGSVSMLAETRRGEMANKYQKVLQTGNQDPRVNAPSLGTGVLITRASPSCIEVPCHKGHIW